MPTARRRSGRRTPAWLRGTPSNGRGRGQAISPGTASMRTRSAVFAAEQQVAAGAQAARRRRRGRAPCTGTQADVAVALAELFSCARLVALAARSRLPSRPAVGAMYYTCWRCCSLLRCGPGAWRAGHDTPSGNSEGVSQRHRPCFGSSFDQLPAPHHRSAQHAITNAKPSVEGNAGDIARRAERPAPASRRDVVLDRAAEQATARSARSRCHHGGLPLATSSREDLRRGADASTAASVAWLACF